MLPLLTSYGMAPLVPSTLPDSSDVARLVRSQLSRIQQQLPSFSPSTLSEFRIVLDQLSHICKICSGGLDELEEKDGDTDVATACEAIDDALDWAKCMFLGLLKRANR